MDYTNKFDYDRYINLESNFKFLNKFMSNDKIEPIWIKCKNCGKLFTQTVYKGKKSLPICPYCQTLNK